MAINDSAINSAAINEPGLTAANQLNGFFWLEIAAEIEIKAGLQMISANLAATDFSVENIAANIDVVRFETQILQADVVIEPVAAGFVINVAKGERLAS